MGNDAEFEEDVDIDVDIDLEGDEDEDEGNDEGNDGEGSKKKETLEQREARLARQLKQTRKKLGKDGDDEEQKPKPKTSKQEKKAKGLDRIDRAVLTVKGITHDDELALVEQIMNETGKSPEQVVESKYFKAELEEMREARNTKAATPNGSKRSSQATSDSVEYWLKKGELPPNDPALRAKVVKAKIAKEKNKNTFSDNAIV